MLEWITDPHDIALLRDLYTRQRDAAQDPVMAERTRLWKEHTALRSVRPMILAETCGVVDELISLSSLQCHQEWARAIERGLREALFRYEQVGDDWVIPSTIDIPWQTTLSDYGVAHHIVRGSNEGKLGSYHWDPPIKNLDHDLDQLHFQTLSVDREATQARRRFLEECFGDILPVRIRSSYWWTTGLTWEAINLIGLEPLMLMLYDNPKGLHRLMAFLRDNFNQMLDRYEEEGLLSLNNDCDYVGSGSIGFSDELPAPDYVDGMPARVKDMWGLSESQETVGVSPKLFEEFVFPYQFPVISRFGMSYYGCCEPVHNRIHIIKRIPNLRKVSVSPWCNEEKIAQALGRDYVYCRKPNPTLISTDEWDEQAMRTDLRVTLRAAGEVGCPLEFAMKDVHTLRDQPHRLGRWVQIAREEIGCA